MAFRLASKLAGVSIGGGSFRSFAAASTAALPPRRFFNSRPVDAKASSGGTYLAAAAAAAAACGVAFAFSEYRRAASTSTVASVATVAAAAPASGEELPKRSLNWRERHFLTHASLQYDGVAYMTPLDFLESVIISGDIGDYGIAPPVHVQPIRKHTSKKRHKRRRRVLSDAEYNAMIRATPGKRSTSDHLFRDIGANGIISYPEFLLLLNVLHKSSYGFEIAFRAFDRNSDGWLDVDEFRCFYRVVAGSAAPDSCSSELLSYGTAQSTSASDTSLLVHFFGAKGRDTVSAAEFIRFAGNIQREVLLVEFQLGCGQTSSSMAPVDFGQAVLRRTRLSGSEQRLRLRLLDDRVWQLDGVTSEEYIQFFQFLMHTDDLFFALRMFDIAGKSIDQDDFQQAVKAATGQSVSPKLLTIVFALFDVDGDGALSYGEFLNLFGQPESVLRNHCIAMGDDETRWEKYKKCVKKYMVLQQ